MTEKYCVHELVRLHYSDIGEYIDENHTDRPLRNDELVDVLNEQDKIIKKLVKENKHLRCIIKSNSKDDYIDYLEKQNERLTERITELACNDKIVFMNR